jgi:hypothetical protein
MDFKLFLNAWDIAKAAKVAYMLFAIICVALGEAPPDFP